MTPGQLEKYILASDNKGLVNNTKNLSEKERRKLSNTASKLLKQVKKNYTDKIHHAYNTYFKNVVAGLKRNKIQHAQSKEQYKTAQLAAYAFCPLPIVKKIDFWGFEEYRNIRLQILLNRKPDWIDNWVSIQLSKTDEILKWNHLRALIKASAAVKPTSKQYLNLMVDDLPDSRYKKNEYVPISEKLKACPDILEDELWRLFNTETKAFTNNLLPDLEYPDNYETWQHALVNLASQGIIDRQRLIDSCFKGLNAGFTKNSTLSGYIKLLKLINPSKQEILDRKHKYINLLTHPANHVVSFAIKEVKTIEKLKGLDDRVFTQIAPGLLSGSVKSQTNSCLTILQKILKRNSELKNQVLQIIAQGFQHNSADIQEKVIEILEKWTDDINCQELVTPYLHDLSPALKSRADALLGRFGGLRPADEDIDNQHDITSKLDDYRQRINLIDDHFKKLAGIDSVVEALQENTDYLPLYFKMYDVPIISDLKPITPIQSLQELIDAVTHVLEHVDSADEIERIIDGISRLCTEKPKDFKIKTALLLKIIVEDGGGSSRTGLFGGYSIPSQLVRLLLDWLGDQTGYNIHHDGIEIITPSILINARLIEICSRMLSNKQAPLLSMPTHQHGWIDPRVFVNRMLHLQRNNIDIPQYDYMHALLRLTPDFRKEALILAESITGIHKDITKWALGFSEIPKKLSKKHKALWLTAGRARDPFSDLSNLHKYNTRHYYPDGITPARYQWIPYLERNANDYNNDDCAYPSILISNGPEDRNEINDLSVPLSLMHVYNKQKSDYNTHYGYNAHSPWHVQWCAMIWPQNTDAFSVASIMNMVGRIEMNSSIYDPNHAYFDIYFEPDRPLTEMSVLMIWLGLAGRDIDAKGTAIDLLAETITDGRAHHQPLANVFVKLCLGGWIKLNRIGDSLKEIARLSQLHGYVVMNVLKKWLSLQTKLTRDAHHMLTLLLDLLNQFGVALEENESRILLKVKGTGKTAKLAKALLNHKPDALTTEHKLALLQQLEARIDRAQRWQKAKQSPDQKKQV